MLAELEDVGKRGGLNGFERVKNIHLTSEVFTIEDNLLTPTMKLRRFTVRKKFTAEIAALYKELHARGLGGSGSENGAGAREHCTEGSNGKFSLHAREKSL